MDCETSYTLSEVAEDLRDVSAALQIFVDEVPEEPNLRRYLEDLLMIADALDLVDRDYPDYARKSRRLETDVELLLASIDLTLTRLRDMFQATRYRAVNGTRPYRRAWDDFCRNLKEDEGISMGPRIDTYSLFIKNILDSLKRYESAWASLGYDVR